MQGVTEWHIHNGKLNENSPVVVTLFNDSSTNEVSETGSMTADKLNVQWIVST